MLDDLMTRRVEATARAMCEYRTRWIGHIPEDEISSYIDREWQFFADQARFVLAAVDAVGAGEAALTPEGFFSAEAKLLGTIPLQVLLRLSSSEWTIVPREATPEMIQAGRLARMNIEGGYGGPSPWEAMLAAAPSPEPG